MDSLLSEPPGKSKNTGVGSLSLLQGVFPTQESNQHLLHCRQILYHMNYQGRLWEKERNKQLFILFPSYSFLILHSRSQYMLLHFITFEGSLVQDTKKRAPYNLRFRQCSGVRTSFCCQAQINGLKAELVLSLWLCLYVFLCCFTH